jgi:hypothetical protein
MLHIFAKEHSAFGMLGRCKQDAIPPGKAVSILDLPCPLRDREIIGRRTKVLELLDISPGFAPVEQIAMSGRHAIEFI